MIDFSKAEVLAALATAEGELAMRANFLDDPNVIAVNHSQKATEVSRLDRRAQALRYARELIDERWNG